MADFVVSHDILKLLKYQKLLFYEKITIYFHKTITFDKRFHSHSSLVEFL